MATTMKSISKIAKSKRDEMQRTTELTKTNKLCSAA